MAQFFKENESSNNTSLVKQVLVPFSLLIVISIHLHAQELVFADQFGGNDTQSATSITSDHSGNIFVSCVFYDEMDADPGAGEDELNAAGSGDVALIKLSSAGNFIWAIQLGGIGFETARKVVTDIEGNVLITGYFHNTIDFDPGPGVYNLTAAGGEDGFLAKYDNDGNLLWAYNIGSSGTEEFYGLDVDSAGNVYTIGYFQNIIDFDPGSGVTNLTAIGGNGLFFWKLDGDGNFIWAKQIAYVFANDLHLDDDANLLVTGAFYGTIDFNPGAGTYNLTATGFGNDAFILKLDKDGIFQWAGKMSGSSEEAGLSVWFDSSSQKILVGGRFEGTVDFDPGNGTTNLTSSGYYDAFVESFNSNGSFDWVKSFGGAGYDEVSSLQTDDSKNIHLSGAFEQTCDFDPSNNSFNLTSNGSTDGYLAVWDSSENFSSAFQIGGALDDWPLQMVLDDEGSILTCGYFSWTVDFDPGPDSLILSTITGWDGFAAKYCTSYTIENFVSICSGESYYAGGAYQTESGIYYDYYNPTVGCDSTVITHLSVNHPLVDLGNDTAICENDFLLLDAGNPGAQYLWSNGDTTQMIEVNTIGSFSVTVTDVAGCVGGDTIIVSQSPSPTVDLGNDVAFCHGNSVILNAGNPGSKYLWNNGDTTKKIHVDAGGIYSVVVTNAAGCKGYDTVVVTENPLPIVNLGSDGAFCTGDSLQLDAGNTDAEFLWNNGDTTQTINVNTSGDYSVIVTDINGCAASDTVLIIENPLPQVDFGNDLEICEGDSVLLDAGNPGSEYLWSTGEATQTIYASSSSSYSVTVIDIHNCKASDSVQVNVLALPQIYFSFSSDTTVCLSSASFPLPQAFPPGGLYSGDGISENVFNPAIAGLGDHLITYSYTDSVGCSNDSSFTITVTICAGIELANTSARIYPNPTDGIIVLERSEPCAEIISLADASGKIIRRITVGESAITTIDLGGLASGIYFLKDDTSTFIKKVFISHR